MNVAINWRNSSFKFLWTNYCLQPALKRDVTRISSSQAKMTLLLFERLHVGDSMFFKPNFSMKLAALFK
jgi:hypothetical protein